MSATPKSMADAIRVLTMDAVNKAKSGHQGMPLGMADVATQLWTRFLKYDASQPLWELSTKRWPRGPSAPTGNR